MALYRLSLNAANLEYFIDNVLQFSSPLAGVTSHTINAGATNDTLQIVGLISLTGGITFNGGAQSGSPGDTLVVQGGTVSSATVSFTNASDGSVVLTSGAISATYNFTGLEPVDMTGTTAADQVFNLPGGTNAQLEDDGTIGNNISQIRETLGGFETTTFTHPTNSLTINGGVTADNLNVNLADTLGGIALTINIAGTTTFTNLGSPSTPLASVTTNAAGTTLIDTSAITTTGAQTYNDAVTLGTDTALTSTGAGAIAFNSTVDGAQTLTASTGGTVTFGAAVGSGTALTALGISASTVSFNGINNVGTLAANLTGGGLTYTDADVLDIGAAGTVSGISAASLALTTGGNITQSAGSVTVGGTTTLDAGATSDITLNNAANNFGTVSVASGNDVTLTDVNAIDLGASFVSGNLAVTANGAITDSGALNVTGTISLAAGTGNSITLDNAANNFGTVSIVSGNHVFLSEGSNIDLGASTVSGTLSVTAAGAITDSSALAVTGTTTLTAGAGNNITLDNAGNNFGGAVSISGNNVTLVDLNAIDLGNSTVSGTLAVTAAGAITDSSALAVTGTTTLTAGITNDITLDNAANNFGGAVSVASGNNVTLNDASAIDFGASTVSGSLFVTANGSLTQTGALNVTGASFLGANSNDITLNNISNDFGTLGILSASNVTLVDLNAIDLGNSSVSGNLTVNASGAITDSGLLSVNGTTTLAAGVGNDITLNNASNDFGGAVTILAAKDVTLQDANAIALAGATVQSLSVTAAASIALTGNVDTTSGLTVNAGNATTASGTISGAGGLTQAGGVTTLSAINSYTGATTINAGTLLVNGSIASSALTTVSAGTLGGTNGTVGAVNIASGGTLSPGASAGILTANGAVTFTAGANFNVEIGGTTAGDDYDRLVAGDSVSLADATLNASLLGSPVVGTEYKIIDKVSPGAVSGTFDGIANGSTVTIGGQAFQIDYAGGDGNDVTLSLGTLKISGSDPDPIAVLADVNTTTIAGTNFTSPSQSAVRDQLLNGDISGTVNAGVTVNGFGLDVSSSKAGGAVNFVNNGVIVIDNAGADGFAALFLSGNGGGVTYSGTGTISNHADTPNSTGLSIASSGGIGGTNLVEVAGSITGSRGIDTADGTTTIVVTGTVTGTGGTAILFSNASSNNTVDLKPGAVITGNLDGSGNDDTVRLSGTSGSGTFDLGKVGADFSVLVKGEAATWTVTGTLNSAVGTVVRNGTLLVDGTVGTVLVTDGFGEVPPALLGGTGTVGNVIVQSAGILAPGASAGTLTSAGNVTLSTGSIFRVEIGGTTAGSQYDVLHLSGTGLSGLIDLGSATIQASLIGSFTPTVGQVFRIIDNDDTDAVSNTFAGMSEGAGVLVSGQAFRVSYVGGDGNDVTLTAIVGGSGPPSLTGFGPSVEIEQAGPAAVPQILDSDVVFADAENNFNSGTFVVSGLLAEDTVSVVSLGFDPGQFLIDDVAGPSDNLYFEGVLIGVISGGTGSTLDVTFNANATSNAIDALIENLTYLNSSSNPTFSRTLSLNVTDAGAGSTGANPITVKVFNGVIETGGAGDDSFTITGNAHIDAGAGSDTVTFGFRLVDATVNYSGNQVIIDGPSIHTVLSGFEKFVFADGTVDNNDGNPLVDDLFYYSRYHDVWNAHVDADAHYDTTGWHEGRDPSAFFDTSIYLSANPDVAAAGINPLAHYDVSGWKEARVPSLAFDGRAYLEANPDVAAAHVDPLAHFLAFGASEGRQPIAPTHLAAPDGFDFAYYLAQNPDVAAANVDPLQHFRQFGWKEGRDPNALFDVKGYLATYADVAAAGVNPLEHFHQFGWKEGRDPSVNFDTSSYLAAYADVAAASINPLVHFLTFGEHEGRSPFADGVWG